MNILLIVADDLGWNDVGFHSPKIHTPTIDHLALTGLRIEKSYSFAVCTPSRTAMVTGNYPHKYGLQSVIWPWDIAGIDTNAYLLSNFLKENGYSTNLIGKWNLGNQKPYQPLQRGYDYHFGMLNGMLDYWNHTWYTHDLHENGNPVYPSGHATDLFTEKALEVVKNHDTNKPMFLHMCYNAAHIPLQPGLFADYYSRIEPNENRRNYCALVSHIDFSIARIIAALDAKKMLDDTLIWFMSDNGGWPPGGADNTPFRGTKATQYEGGIRNVNFINYKKINSGEIFSGVCHAIDVFPTIAGFLNKSVQTDGVNIFDPNSQNRPFIIYLLEQEGGIVYNDWKYLKFKNHDELYDLKNDPIESKNVINDNKAIADNLKQILESKKHEVVPQITCGQPSPTWKVPKYAGEEQEQVPLFLITAPPQPKTFAELSEFWNND